MFQSFKFKEGFSLTESEFAQIINGVQAARNEIEVIIFFPQLTFRNLCPDNILFSFNNPAGMDTSQIFGEGESASLTFYDYQKSISKNHEVEECPLNTTYYMSSIAIGLTENLQS